MGRTKALIPIDGVPMATLVAAALRDAGCDRVLAYGGDPTELADLGLTVMPDRYPGTGPLGGVLGVLELLVDEPAGARAFVVACDLPSLRGCDLAPLVAAADRHVDADVVVARTSTIEPACALWRTTATERIRGVFDGGERALHAAIARLNSVEVDVAASSVRNINTQDQLDRYP